MRKRFSKTLILLGLLAIACPSWAKHGLLSSTDREEWINANLNDLVTAGLLPSPAKPVKDLTNLEVAQLTSRAGETLLAQADLGLPPALPPGGDLSLPEPTLPAASGLPSAAGLPAPQAQAAAKSMSQLVEEFRDELTALGADLPQLEDRIWALQHRNDSIADLQKHFLKKVGTEAYGYSRGYMDSFRGFGPNALYLPEDFNAMVFMDMSLKSVPVPLVLFQSTIRFWRTDGLYYAEAHPTIDLRWISLTHLSDIATVTAGDMFQHYTPLTLWNYEVPVFTLIEPSTYYRTRKDVEELAFMDHGPDWHLRGFQASTLFDWTKESAFLGIFKAQAMAGPLKAASQYKFGDYFAGSQASMSFFSDNLEFKGAGLMIWDDPDTGAQPYNPNFPLTFGKRYQIGSFSARAKIPFASDVDISGTGEYAGTDYQDDVNNPLRDFQDWAMLGTASINISGVHLTGKYYNVGPYFYSPGAQTNRFAPFGGSSSYLSTNNNGEDDYLIGYLNRYPLQSASRPNFAPFDRMTENMLPYGDATPNRLGVVAGVSIDIGKDGWLKPQASWTPPLSTLQMHEIQSNYVLNPQGNGAIDVDSATNTGNARTFGGYEAALTVDLAKAFEMQDKTYQIAFDYKNQTTDLGNGGGSYAVKTFIGAVDFSVPISGFESVVLSGAFEQAQSSGSEYVLNGVGNPGTIANYPFYLDTTTLGQYSYTPLNITRTSWSAGLLYPLSKTIRFHADYFFNQYTWNDVPGYDRRDSIWRFTYEAAF